MLCCRDPSEITWGMRRCGPTRGATTQWRGPTHRDCQPAHGSPAPVRQRQLSAEPGPNRVLSRAWPPTTPPRGDTAWLRAQSATSNRQATCSRTGRNRAQALHRIVFVYIVRPPPVNVVDVTGVRRLVLCAGAVYACACLRIPCSRCVYLLCVPLLYMLASCALRVPAVHALAVHACVVRACASHARVACTCCASPCCACPRGALSCWSCGVLVQRSLTSCEARRHHTPRRPRRLDMPFTLSPSSVTSDCTCHALFPPSLPQLLLVLCHMLSLLFCPPPCLCCFLPIAMRF